MLESEGIIVFNVSDVLLSKCYLILRNSLKLSGHSSSRIASESWDPVQEVVSTSVPPSSAESMESHEHGVHSGWVCNARWRVPTLIGGAEAKRWEGLPSVLLRPLGLLSGMATCRVRARSWSGRPPTASVFGQSRDTEGGVGSAYLCYKVGWRKYSAN